MKSRKTKCVVGRRTMGTQERCTRWSEQFERICIKVWVGQKVDESLKSDIKEN